MHMDYHFLRQNFEVHVQGGSQQKSKIFHRSVIWPLFKRAFKYQVILKKIGYVYLTCAIWNIEIILKHRLTTILYLKVYKNFFTKIFFSSILQIFSKWVKCLLQEMLAQLWQNSVKFYWAEGILIIYVGNSD